MMAITLAHPGRTGTSEAVVSTSSPEALPGPHSRAPLPTGESLACPACSTGRLVPDGEVARCPVCGHEASTALVAEAAWLLTEQARLVARLAWVQERIAAADVTGAPGLTGSAASGRPATTHPAARPGPTRPGPTRPEQPPLAAQTLLLGGGATLMVIAAVVFAAVAWDRIGAWGQLGLLAVVVAALSGAAHGLRHRFRATAETLAAIAAAVAAVGLVAAPRLGLGAAWMRERSWAWAGIALLAVAVLSLALRVVSGLAAWRVATVVALLAAAVSVTFALSPGSWQGPSPLAVAVLAILGAVLLVIDARTPARTLAGAVAGNGQPGRGEQGRGDLGWLGIGASLIAAALVLPGYADDAHRFQWAVVWAVLAISAIAVRAVVLTPESAGRANLRELVSGWAGVAAGNVAVLAVCSALGPARSFDLSNPDQVTGSALAALLGLALLGSALAIVTTWRRSELTPRLEASVAGLAAALTIWLLAPGQVSTRETVTTTLVCGYLALIAATCFVVAVGHRLPGWPGWVGAAVGSVAVWVLLGNHSVSTLEAYSLTSAGLLLLAGAVVWLVGRRSPADDVSSLTLAGPALAMALLPSAVWAFGEAVAGQGPQRGVLVLAVGAVLAVGGAVLRWQAPFVVGLAAALIAAAGQLWSLSDLVPRWVALAAAGALLVGAGFGFELVSTTGRRFWTFTRALR